MQVKTLACDWCPIVRPAIGSPTLVLGAAPSKGDPRIDLCRGHLAELIQSFRPLARTAHQRSLGRRRVGKSLVRMVTARVEHKRKQALEKYYRERATRKPRSKAHAKQRTVSAATRLAARAALMQKYEREWQLTRQAILGVMPNGGQRLSLPAIQALAKLGHSRTYTAVRQLVERQGLVAHGPRGRYRTYALPVA